MCAKIKQLKLAHAVLLTGLVTRYRVLCPKIKNLSHKLFTTRKFHDLRYIQCTLRKSTNNTLFFQLELETDLVVDHSDCFKKAIEKWKNIVPAIISYSESFTGKFGETLKKVRDDHQGEPFKLCIGSNTVHLSMYTSMHVCVCITSYVFIYMN